MTTANSLDMPRPLLDRMEIIRLSGYTEDEKIEIAKRHLIPKIFSENAVKESELAITEDAIRDIPVKPGCGIWSVNWRRLPARR